MAKEVESVGIPSVVVQAKAESKMFPIRHKETRMIKDAFIENEEFFLGIADKFNSAMTGVFYIVCMFSKEEWQRL